MRCLMYGLNLPVVLYVLSLLSVLPLAALEQWSSLLAHLLLILFLYSWHRIGLMESREDRKGSPWMAAVLAHLPYLLLAGLDLAAMAGRLGGASVLLQMLLPPLRFPVTAFLEVVLEMNSLWMVFGQYMLNLAVFTVFFILGRKQLPLRWRTILPLVLGQLLSAPVIGFMLWLPWVGYEILQQKN